MSLFVNPGYKKWYVQAERCLRFWMADRKKWITCGGRCIAVCPWNKPRNAFHDLVRWLAIHGSADIRKLLVRGDRFVYHRHKSIKNKMSRS